MATDWAALRVEYVNSAISLRELADRHGVRPAGVMQRAAREGWEAERKQLSAVVSMASTAVIMEDRVATLARFNAEDVRAAENVRAKAMQLLESVDEPTELRALAAALDTAQKISRLALGAETAHTVADVTHRELPASVDDFV